MTREAQIAALLLADAQFMALVPGGVYTYEQVMIEGIKRGDDSITKDAFDARGDLLVTAMVRQRAPIPLDSVRNPTQKFVATNQAVEIYYYEFRGYTGIEAAKLRAYSVLEGVRLEDSYQIWWDYETTPIPDVGPVQNSTTVRQDWRIMSIRRG